MNLIEKNLSINIYITFLILALTFLFGLRNAWCDEIIKTQPVKTNNYITQGSFKGGVFTDGLDIKSIRWADHNSYERLVFDIYKWGGPNNPKGLLPNEYPGRFNIKFESDKL